MAEPQGKQPDVLTPTADLSREEWLSFRCQGIGGSDAAAVLGISPFRTGVDLYYDKLGQPVEDDEQNWVAKEVGTLLEDLVARIFAKKTGLKVWPMPVMYRHPDHPCMLADIDRLVMLPKGETAILECKTTNANATSKWEYDGKPIVPLYYEAQARHYYNYGDKPGRVYGKGLSQLFQTKLGKSGLAQYLNGDHSFTVNDAEYSGEEQIGLYHDF